MSVLDFQEDPNTQDPTKNYPGGSPTFQEYTPPSTSAPAPTAPAPAPTASNPNAPAFGQPSLNSGDISTAYQQAFGRAPTAAELASEQENANKYSASGVLDQIARRTNNTPNTGDAGTATAASLGMSIPGYRTASGSMVPGTAPKAPTFQTPRVPNVPNTSPQFTDPSQQLLESYALNRMQQLQNPDPNSGPAMYEQYAKQLVDQLKAAPYTQGDEAAIKAGAYNSINQDEQTTMQQWLEEISRRGLRPSDGPALEGLQHIKESFNKLRAGVDQQFASQAIQLGRTQRMQALDVLGNLQASENTRLDKAGTVARIPYDLGTDSFNQNIQAVNAGGSPAQNVQSAIQLAQAIQNANNISAQQKSYALSAIFEFLGGL